MKSSDSWSTATQTLLGFHLDSSGRIGVSEGWHRDEGQPGSSSLEMCAPIPLLNPFLPTPPPRFSHWPVSWAFKNWMGWTEERAHTSPHPLLPSGCNCQSQQQTAVEEGRKPEGAKGEKELAGFPHPTEESVTEHTDTGLLSCPR